VGQGLFGKGKRGPGMYLQRWPGFSRSGVHRCYVEHQYVRKGSVCSVLEDTVTFAYADN